MNSYALGAWLVVALVILFGVALARWERRKREKRMDEALQRAFFAGSSD
jgi:hypothetical protein